MGGTYTRLRGFLFFDGQRSATRDLPLVAVLLDAAVSSTPSPRVITTEFKIYPVERRTKNEMTSTTANTHARRARAFESSTPASHTAPLSLTTSTCSLLQVSALCAKSCNAL